MSPTCARRRSSRRSSSLSRKRCEPRVRDREDQPCARRRPSARRRLPRGRDGPAANRSRRPDRARAPRPSCVSPGSPATRSSGARSRRSRPETGAVLARPGSRSTFRSQRVSAAAAPTRRRRSRSQTSRCRAARRDRLHELAARLGSDVPFFLTSGPQLATGTGTDLEALDLPQDYWVVLVLAGRRAQAVDGGRLRRVRRRRRLRRAARGIARVARRRQPNRRSCRAAAERPGDVTARGRAPRGRRVSRRRERSRAGRVRALHARARRGGCSASVARSRADLGHGSCLVRLSRVSSDAVIDHDSSRTGRWLRPRRVRIALWIAVVESILAAVTHDISRVTIVVLAAIVVPIYFIWGTQPGRHDPTGHVDRRRVPVARRRRRVLLAYFLGLIVLVVAGLFAAVALFLIFLRPSLD